MNKATLTVIFFILLSSITYAQRGTAKSNQIPVIKSKEVIKQKKTSQDQLSLAEVLDAINNNKKIPKNSKTVKEVPKKSFDLSSTTKIKKDTITYTNDFKKNKKVDHSALTLEVSKGKDVKINKSNHPINSMVVFNKSYNELTEIEKIQLKAKQLEYDKQKK